jgi:hypothetical protein
MFGFKKEKYGKWYHKLMFLFNVIIWIGAPFAIQQFSQAWSGFIIVSLLMYATYDDFFPKSKFPKFDFFEAYKRSI